MLHRTKLETGEADPSGVNRMKTGIHLFMALVFLIITLLFNMGLIDIRFEEVHYLLGKAAFNQDASNAIGIVSKYELIKRRMESGEESEENYELEARIQALLSGDQFAKEKTEMAKKKKYLVPVRVFLNSIRFVLGKEVINTREEDKIISVLEIGYFWERNRKYGEAIKIYENVLGMSDISGDVRSAVLIHKAFCYSMISDYKKAKELYESVINMYPNTEAGILSWKLLDFLDKMEIKREEVRTTTLTNFDKAKQYYLVMDYRNAIKFFSLFLQSNSTGTLIAEAKYFKGRSHEELGETEEAVDEYRQTIKNDTTKKWGREANRRMLMLGDFYDYKKKMAEEARKQLAAYQDDSFISKMGKFKNMMSTSTIKVELGAGEKDKAKTEAVDANIMNLIDSIGDLDLTGAKERQAAIKKEMEKIIRAGVKSEVEIRELERKIALADNPFRKPTFLKKTIDGNGEQLKYIYNKRLRKGVKLSGKMVVEMTIEPAGALNSVKVVNSNMGDREFEEEVVAKIQTWKFSPVADSLGVLKIQYPFEFYEEE